MLTYPRIRKKETKEIILEDLDFTWKTNEINLAKELWVKGKSMKDITKSLKREGDEVFLLLLHLSRQGQIIQRKGGIYG